MAPRHVEIVRVVERRDLDSAGAELGVDVIVGDDRDAPPDDGELDLSTHQSRVAVVLGMHGDRHVAEHRLGPGGGDHDGAVTFGRRVPEVPETSVDLPRLHLEVGHCGPEHRRPVHHVLTAVHQPLAVELDERRTDRRRQAFVQGETLAGEVTTGAEPFELAADVRVVLLLPLPGALQERLPPDLETRSPFGLELPLHHQLGCDARVVRSGEPQGIEALHAFAANDEVLQRALQRMAHVQFAGDVGRRDHDAEARPLAALLAAEQIGLRPLLLPLLLVLSRLESRLHGGDYL